MPLFQPSQPGPAYVDDGSALGSSKAPSHDHVMAKARVGSPPPGPFARSCSMGSSTIGQKTTAPRVPLPSTARLAHLKQRAASVGGLRNPRPSPTDVIVDPSIEVPPLALDGSTMTSVGLPQDRTTASVAFISPLRRQLVAPGSSGSTSVATPPTPQAARKTTPPEPPPRSSPAKSPVNTPPEPPPRTRRSTTPRRTSQATTSIATRLSQTTTATATATATPIAMMGGAETAVADAASPGSSPSDLPMEFYPRRESSSALFAVSEVGDCDARMSCRIRASTAFSRQRQQAAELAAETGQVTPPTSSDASPTSDRPASSPPLPPPRARAYSLGPSDMPSRTTVRPSEAPPAATFEMELTLPGPNGDVKIRVAVPLDKIKGYDPSKISTARVMPSAAQAITLNASAANGADDGGRGGDGGGGVPPTDSIPGSSVSLSALPLATDGSRRRRSHQPLQSQPPSAAAADGDRGGDGATGATGTTGATIATSGAGGSGAGAGGGRKVVRKDAYFRSLARRRTSDKTATITIDATQTVIIDSTRTAAVGSDRTAAVVGSMRTGARSSPVPVLAHRVLTSKLKAPAPRYYVAANVIETGDDQKGDGQKEKPVDPRSVALQWLEAQCESEDDTSPARGTGATERKPSVGSPHELSPSTMQQLGLPPAAKNNPVKMCAVTANSIKRAVGRRAIVQAWVDNSASLYMCSQYQRQQQLNK